VKKIKEGEAKAKLEADKKANKSPYNQASPNEQTYINSAYNHLDLTLLIIHQPIRKYYRVLFCYSVFRFRMNTQQIDHSGGRYGMRNGPLRTSPTAYPRETGGIKDANNVHAPVCYFIAF